MRVRLLIPAVAVAVVLALPCSATDSTKAEINKVITSFQLSLRKHDVKELVRLFLADSDAWVTTLGDDTLKAMRNQYPTAPHDKMVAKEIIS